MNGVHNIALRYFLTASTEDVLSTFSSLDRAVSGRGFVYVPGRRAWSGRLLLCAHADTTRKHCLNLVQLRVSGDEEFTTADTDSLGADDRAGCAMLQLLHDRHQGAHSLLICDGEESGGLGAQASVLSLLSELRDHAFAVEVDRAGSEEMVFYNGTSNELFEETLKQWFPKWKQGLGSFTDISTVCPETGICGVNLAIGYRGQHSSWERLVYADWLKTYKLLDQLLSQETYPDFGEPDPEVEIITDYSGQESWWKGNQVDDTDDTDEWWERYQRKQRKALAAESACERVTDADKYDSEELEPGVTIWLPVLNAAGDPVGMVESGKVTDEERNQGFMWAEPRAAESVDEFQAD